MNARVWTLAQDATIIEMRAAGDTWAAIGERLGISRNTVIERGRRIRAVLGVALPAPDPEPRRGTTQGPREVLPAGHPVTWGLLTSEPWQAVAG